MGHDGIGSIFGWRSRLDYERCEHDDSWLYRVDFYLQGWEFQVHISGVISVLNSIDPVRSNWDEEACNVVDRDLQVKSIGHGHASSV